MLLNLASFSRIGGAAGACLILAACGSEAPDTVQYPAAPPGVESGSAARSAPTTEPASPSASGTSSASLPASSDGTLAAMVESAIAAEPELNTLGIEIDVVDGTVFLRGEAHDREIRRLATEVASSVDGVQHVENQLVVRAGTQRSELRPGTLTALR